MKKTLVIAFVTLFFTSLATAQYVTLYSDCDYKGKLQLFKAGRYSLSNSRVGAYNVSSIRVPNGMRVVVYSSSEPGTGPSKISYSSDISCLPGEWNDKIGSIVVENNDGGGNNYDNSGDDGVTVYADCNYRGSSKMLNTGNYKSYQLGVGNDAVSSIRIPRGYSITVYSDDNYQGSSTTYSSDVYCLNSSWNDKISSVTVHRGNYNSGNNGGGRNSGSRVVTLFKDCDYSGLRKELSTGTYTKYQLGVGNDALSSFQIPSGMSVTIYKDDNFGGGSTSYYNDVKCLDDEWNDKVSSIRVERNGSGGGGYRGNNNSDYDRNAVILYEDCDYNGRSKTIYGTGYYNLSKMGISNDQLSSFRLPIGYSLTIYENDNFTGRSTTMSYDVSCLSSNWNDKASSIRIDKRR